MATSSAPALHLKDARRVLAIEAHPDDIEVGAGATLALLARSGATVDFASLTGGDRGTAIKGKSLAEVRSEREGEARAAAALLGVRSVHVLPFEDMLLADTPQTRGAVVDLIRELRPDTVFCLDPNLSEESHPDHIAAGRIALAASIFAAFPHAPYASGDVWSCSRLVLYGTDRPNLIIDVSDTWDLKWQALALHASQFPAEQLRSRREVITNFAKAFGSQAGAGIAEPLRLMQPREIHMNFLSTREPRSSWLTD